MVLVLSALEALAVVGPLAIVPEQQGPLILAVAVVAQIMAQLVARAVRALSLFAI